MKPQIFYQFVKDGDIRDLLVEAVSHHLLETVHHTPQSPEELGGLLVDFMHLVSQHLDKTNAAIWAAAARDQQDVEDEEAKYADSDGARW